MGSEVSPTAIYSRPEAAALLGVKPATLANWKSMGIGPKCARPGGGRRGGLVYYRGQSILDWLRSLEEAA